MPVILNPGPVVLIVLICEIVMLTFPVLLTIPGFVLLVPSLTLPKFWLVGLVVSCASGAAAPVPVKGKLFGEPEALLTSETEPLTMPVVAGAKCTVNEVVALAANVNGRLIPVTL